MILICAFCNKEFTRKRTNPRSKEVVCSLECRGKLRKQRNTKTTTVVRITTQGYIREKAPGQESVLQHRRITGALPGQIVHHIDGDRTNNDPANLQVMTRAEHAQTHAQITGRASTNPKTLSKEQVFTLLDMLASGTTNAAAAKVFHLNKSTVSLIRHGHYQTKNVAAWREERRVVSS